MNKYIREELEKIKAPMSSYDDKTTVIQIEKRKSVSTSSSFTIGTKYRISVEDYILNEPPNFTLSANWNRGIVPTSRYFEGTVVNIQGNMIQFNLVGFDIDSNTEKDDKYVGLWLPKKSITVLGEYKLIQ